MMIIAKSGEASFRLTCITEHRATLAEPH